MDFVQMIISYLFSSKFNKLFEYFRRSSDNKVRIVRMEQNFQRKKVRIEQWNFEYGENIFFPFLCNEIA